MSDASEMNEVVGFSCESSFTTAFPSIILSVWSALMYGYMNELYGKPSTP